MRRLNARAVIIVLVCATVLGAGAVGLHGLQLRRNAGALLERAALLEADGRRDEALDCLGRYLQLAPDDGEAFARYALLLDGTAASPDARLRAYLSLDQALRLNPERHDVRRAVIRAANRLQRPLDARHHIERLLTVFPNDGELELALGQCLEATGEHARAADWLRKGVQHAPRDLEGAARLADLLRRRLQLAEEADGVMDQMVQANADSAAAYLARAKYRRQFAVGDPAEDVARARELSPDDTDVLLAAADVAVEAGRPQEAEAHLRHGLELKPAHAPLRLALVRLCLRSGDAEQAAKLLEEGLQATPRHADLLWSLVDLHIQLARHEDAETILARLSQTTCPDVLCDFHRARILLGKGRWLQCARLMERVRPLLGPWPELPAQADLVLAQAYEHLGDNERQLAAHRRVLAADPHHAAARHGLGAGLLAGGRIEEALAEYRRLTRQKDSPPAAWLMLARLLVLQNLRLPTNRRDWAEAEGVLEQAALRAPQDVDVPILQAEILVARGRLDDAEAVLQRALDHQRDQLEIWGALAGVIQKRGDATRAKETLERAAKEFGDTAPMRLTFLGFWVKQGGPEGLRHAAELETGWEGFAPADQLALRNGLGEALFRLGDGASAARHWSWVAERRPEDLRTRLLLFDLAAEAGDDARMQEVLSELQRIEGDSGAWWRYGEVLRLLRRARAKDSSALPVARRRLTEIISHRPNWSRVPLLQAEVEELVGNAERALEHYQQAIELGHRQPEMLRRVIQLLFERRRYYDADQLIRQLEEQSPLSGDLRRLAATVSLHTRDPERALSLAREAVRSESAEPRDYVWLGQILGLVDQRAEAEAAFRRAIELKDTIPDGWVALIQHLARNERVEEAEQLIEEARGRINAEESALALAQCFEAVGRRDRADELYREALEKQPNVVSALRGAASFYLRSGQSAKAEPLLRKVVDPATKAKADEIAWARRTLAVGLAARGGFERFREAMSLMESSRGVSGSADDQRARAVVLATRPGRRREAIGILETLLARGTSTPDDQFLLAQLHENDHDWPKARETMLALLSAHGHNATYVAHYARSLLKNGERAEADHWIAKLEKLESRTWRATELKARLHHARGDADEAKAILLAYARLKETSAGPVAVVLDQLGQVAAAEEMYRKYVGHSHRPESTLVLAEFLGRQGRVAEALQLCQEAWKTCSPETVAGVCVAIIRAGNGSPDQVQQVADWIRAAADQHPSSIPLLMSLAETWYLQARYPEAASLYRQVLARDQRNVVALNNLAWLLSLRERRPAEAMELVKQAVELAGGETDLLDTPSTLYLTVGQRNLVIRDLVPDLLDTRAVVHIALGRSDLAIRDLEDAIDRTPTGYRYFHLAQAYQGVSERRMHDLMAKALDLGLKSEDLHPLERDAFRALSDKADTR